ncbi:EAL domain-containing protein [Micromonospora sp. GCM10011542]|uniref:EAL domain-containing protein n=1 Tax=Micromonospora sp. GCM10011542 TaxID=3317337 RepID=UPI003613DB2C
MLLAYPFRLPVPRRVAPEAAVSTAVALLVLAGVDGLVPAPVVVALAGGAGATLAGVRLSRLAAADPAQSTSAPSTGRSARGRADRRSVAVLLDAAVVAAGVSAALLPLLAAGHRAAALAGSLLVAALALGGLLRLPGRPRPSIRVRLGRLSAAGGPAVGLSLAGWLLLPRAAGPAPARLLAVVALGGLGMGALCAFTGTHRRAGVATCRGGALLLLFGIVLLTTLPPTSAGRAALLAVPPLVVGMLLTALGAAAALAGEPAVRAAPAWPRVVLPAAVLLLAAGLHLGAGRAFDRTTVLLALAAVPPLVLREMVRAGTPERPAAHSRRGTGRPVRHRRAGSLAVGRPQWLGTAAGGSLAGLPAWPAVDAGDRSDPAGAGGPDEPATLLDALAAIGDVPAPAGALLLVDLHGTGAEGVGPTLRDDLLAEAVRRAHAVVGPADTVAGWAGAGFAVVTPAGPLLAYALGNRLLAALTTPYELAGSVLRVQASIGLAEVGGTGPVDVLRQAELARRRAVQLGRDRVEWYDAFLEEQLVRRLDLERELPGAVARGELDLVYQPVLGLADRQPVGTEALLRWRSPVLGTVLPAELLPVAEDLDLLGELEWWVVDRACRQLAEWSAGARQLWMAVNVTTRELTTPDFVQRTAAVLAAYGVPAELLVVEVAEPRVAADLSTVVARLAGLRSLGVRTALDDFRAEHASLAQLRRLPIDLLKVGPELVAATSDGQPPLIDVVVSVGERLGVEIVAEELETPAQVDGAHRARCRYGQGFGLARPATAERVEAYFEEFPSASR